MDKHELVTQWIKLSVGDLLDGRTTMSEYEQTQLAEWIVNQIDAKDDLGCLAPDSRRGLVVPEHPTQTRLTSLIETLVAQHLWDYAMSEIKYTLAKNASQ